MKSSHGRRAVQEICSPNGRPACRALLSAAAALLLAACVTAPRGGGGEAAAAQITRELTASTQRWNAADLEGFLAPYLDSPGTTFVSGTGLLRGKDAIERRYREGYWKAGAPADSLRFAALEVRPLGPDHALVTGRYELHDATGRTTGQGPFTLVFARTPEGWRIIHDHSS